ncbi:hypothetical protein P168DRAFT_58319 [Aspergillus campestris IBT 28561]|uniref:Uncharacterized protein n=1 Tax=Aspergillus campestris (strain IBT 28561) TaxID=1392248 RepID=A0A2I1CTU1_ASPC2|nr:uncharacterized protein P168DRAFT_58319 [Aspergillus campestris IBT 28561]PKY01031.1 hypothetical protein P168DRAFT_58319 [Aspergillus campestris IBT 28561]
MAEPKPTVKLDPGASHSPPLALRVYWNGQGLADQWDPSTTRLPSRQPPVPHVRQSSATHPSMARQPPRPAPD